MLKRPVLLMWPPLWTSESLIDKHVPRTSIAGRNPRSNAVYTPLTFNARCYFLHIAYLFNSIYHKCATKVYHTQE